MNNIFRYSPKDSLLVIFTLLMLAVPVILAVYTPDWPWLIPIFAAHVWVLVMFQNSAVHHHTHWATFNNKKLNQLYEILLAAAGGYPPAHWRTGHLIHHKYVNDYPDATGKTQDPTSVYFGNNSKTPVNVWVYIFQHGLLDMKYSWFVSLPRMTNQQIESQYKKEKIAFWIFIFIIFSINIWYGLVLMLCHAGSQFFNQCNSYGEHWQYLHHRGDTTRDSFSNYGKIYNLLTFNAGYHQEHHHRPGVHWTRLPSEVTPLLPKDRLILKIPAPLNNPYWHDFKSLFR